MESEDVADQHVSFEKEKPVEHLVLDTGAIVANVNLHTIARHYYAPSDLLEELRSKRVLKTFNTLPFDVKITDPSMESMKAVLDASKKTGDFKSLSVVDFKVIALTYELHQRYSKQSNTDVTVVKADDPEVKLEVEKALKDKMGGMVIGEAEVEGGEEGDVEVDTKDGTTRNLPEGFVEDVEDSEDEEGWITKDNVVDAIKKMGAFEVAEGLKVGCLTTDFALQNVLLSMNLGLVSLTGYRIKKIRSFVLRCRACFSTTAVMTKEFCQSCGNKLLEKCPVSVDENGEQVLHINWRRLENKRGLKHSLAAPKGGKHAMNEKLFEDQRMPQNRMAKVRADPLGDGPFSMHDINSKSAVLGIRTLNNNQSGSRRNPNESRGRRK